MFGRCGPAEPLLQKQGQVPEQPQTHAIAMGWRPMREEEVLALALVRRLALVLVQELAPEPEPELELVLVLLEQAVQWDSRRRAGP